MRYLALILILAGCTTTHTELSMGLVFYKTSTASFQPKGVVQPIDTLALTSIVASQGSIWSSPLLRSAASMLLNLVGGK